MLAPLLTATKLPPCRKWMIMWMIMEMIFDFADSKEFAPPPGRRSRRSASTRPWPRRPRAPGPHLISTKKERMPFEKRNLKEFMENDGKRIIFQNMTSEDLGVDKKIVSINRILEEQASSSSLQFKIRLEFRSFTCYVTRHLVQCSHDTGIFEGILDGSTDLVLGMEDHGGRAAFPGTNHDKP